VNQVAIARTDAPKRRRLQTFSLPAPGFQASFSQKQVSKLIPNEVLNLEGSIFQWANEGRPLFRSDIQVTKVHPFSRRWKGLLGAGLAEVPEEL
jgi:hypothetical protein